MTLTPDEKVAGRWFKAQQQVELDQLMLDDPPTYTDVLWGHSKYRHECTKAGKMAALTLNERYTYSPQITVATAAGQRVVMAVTATMIVEDPVTIPAYRFGFIYKEGKCKCGKTARSPQGFFVEDAQERPPVEGRVAR